MCSSYAVESIILYPKPNNYIGPDASESIQPAHSSIEWTKLYREDTTATEDMSCNISASERGNNSDAMWEFLRIRYTRDKNDPIKATMDNDELCLLDFTSNEKSEIAMPPNDTTVENSLSEALMKLSVNDRSAIEEEVHGVSSTPEETPEFLAWRLHEFDTELMNAKNCPKRLRELEQNRRMKNNNDEVTAGNADNGDVLRNVMRMSADHIECSGEDSTYSTMETEASTDTTMVTSPNIPSAQTSLENDQKKSCYVNDPNVRLRFLRAEGYDAKNAVKRFIGFLVFAQELYGDFVADRPIQLSDFKTQTEKRTLANIPIHFLPFRDRSGRRVYVAVGSCGYDIEPKLRCKILWYMFWVASEDVESQRKGAVIIGWPNNNKLEDYTTEPCFSDSNEKSGSSGNIWDEIRPSILNVEGLYQMKAMVGLPMRVAAIHFCHDVHPMFSILNALFYFALGPGMKPRYKVHVGEMNRSHECCIRCFSRVVYPC